MGLKGEEIPLGGRILAVSDVFDAITSKRHYRQKMNIENALDVIVNGAGSHFDKQIVDIFMNLETHKILEVINNSHIPDSDSLILSKYRLMDIYGLYKNSDSKKFTTEEEQFIKTFSKYYNLT